MKKSWLLLMCMCIVALVSCHSEQHAILKDIDQTPQNALYFINNSGAQTAQLRTTPLASGLMNNAKNSGVSKQSVTITEQSQKLKQSYLAHHFLPWHDPFSIISAKDLAAVELNHIQFYQHQISFGENAQPHRAQWIEKIAINMDLSSFLHHTIVNAIVVNATSLRTLPTSIPAFGNPKLAGQGYPFDQLQNTKLYPNEPVAIVHVSHDRAWNLVISSVGAWGWVKTKDIAIVNRQVERKWESQKNYVTPTQDRYSVLGADQQFYFKTRIGEIYPFLHAVKNNDVILVMIKNSAGDAEIKTAIIPEKIARHWPIKASALNVATLANTFLGNPYGWGDINNYRDCSETMKDLFAPFGIWLPRNSYYQAMSGQYHSIAHLSSAEKQKFIIKNGVPFFTLLWLDGHIMLYIGSINGTVYVFHAPWGIHTKLFSAGRDVIGRAVITPVDFGKGYMDIPETWLDRLQGISVLPDKSPQ